MSLKPAGSPSTSATDPVADMLTKIRNASRAKHERVDISGSHFKAAIADVLKQEGYIRSYKWLEAAPGLGAGHPRTLRVYLKYTAKREPVISNIVRVSKSGRRKFVDTKHLPRVLSGMGIAILSPSRGVMGDAAARQSGVGGEVICYVS